jgi:hypothetical protein
MCNFSRVTWQQLNLEVIRRALPTHDGETLPKTFAEARIGVGHRLIIPHFMIVLAS